ncbi:MAG TPA: hypothetical protein VM493_07890 [Vicinamibacterales bacterium]|nr:hypothetical protein [Vicinamibacterales bacterium]
MPGLSQNERVRRQLVKAGRAGITQAEFSLPHVVDNGKPIPRLAARIHDLNKAGEWPAVQVGERDGFAVYVLKKYLSVPESVLPRYEGVLNEHQQEAAATGASLFDRDTVAGSIARSAIFDDLEDAA